MWRIIKADLVYHRFSTVVVVAIWFAINLTVVIWGWRDFDHDYHGTRSVTYTAACILWLIRLLGTAKHNTNRIHMALPISVRGIAVARALPFLAVWTLVVVLYVGSLLAFRFAELRFTVCHDLLSLTGVILVLNAIPFIHRDLLVTLSNKAAGWVLAVGYTAVIWMSFWAASILPRFGVLASAREAADSFRMTPVGALFPFLLGVALTYLCINTYQWRKAYTE
jgi:hypothetical protein